jgi:hypothetical protein
MAALMQARVVPMRQGMRWLLDGWHMFRASPFGWLALVFVYWLLMSVIAALPVAGIAAASILVPAFSVGFMAAARASSHRAPVTLSLLFDGFRHGVRDQLLLGVVYLACLAVVLGASMLIDGGTLARWMVAGQHPSEDALQTEGFLLALLFAAALYAPVMMMFWFAPPLAAWHASGAPKALFFSFFAALINWRAFLAYGALTALVSVVIPFIMLSALLLASSGAFRLSVMGLVFPLLLVLLPTLFASFYASYRDVFGAAPDAPG